MSKKRLVVLRHAHREVFDPAEDNGLSSKGHKQAAAIQKHFKKHFREVPTLYSSPKLRCRETLQPLADYLGAEIEVLDLLDEGIQIKHGRIENRVKQFRDWWLRDAPPFVVICSHGDWIPLFFELALEKHLMLKKAGWAELKAKDKKVTLKELIQSWDLESF